MANLKEDESAAVSPSAKTQVIRAAGIVGAATLVSRLLGLVKTMVVTAYLGLGLEARAFTTASAFPEAIFFIIAGGAIGSAFIPTFTAYFTRDDETGGWRLFSAIINLITLAVTVLSIIAMIFAPQLITLFVPKLIQEEPALLPLTAHLMRIMLLSSIIFGTSGVIMGTLQARQHFLLPALAPIIYNLGIIGGALVGAQTDWGTAVGMAWGTVIGALGHLLIQLPGLKMKGARYTAVLTLRDPGVKRVLKLMSPRVLGLSFSQINNFIILFLSGLITPESVPAARYAMIIMLMPQGILGQAMGIAAFPTMATLAAQSAWNEMRRIVSDSLRLLLFLALPAAVLLMLLGRPLIAILFQRGAFDAQNADLVAWALLFYAIGLAALAALEVIARSFYALGDTLTPVIAGGLQIGVMAALSPWLINSAFPALGWHPLGGLALGFSLSNFVEVGALLWLLRRKMRGLNGRSLLDGLFRMGAASLLMAAATWFTLTQLEQSGALWQTIVGGLVGGSIYLLASLGLRVTEIQQFWDYGRRQLRRR